jgi:hypothetical protein
MIYACKENEKLWGCHPTKPLHHCVHAFCRLEGTQVVSAPPHRLSAPLSYVYANNNGAPTRRLGCQPRHALPAADWAQTTSPHALPGEGGVPHVPMCEPTKPPRKSHASPPPLRFTVYLIINQGTASVATTCLLPCISLHSSAVALPRQPYSCPVYSARFNSHA